MQFPWFWGYMDSPDESPTAGQSVLTPKAKGTRLQNGCYIIR